MSGQLRECQALAVVDNSNEIKFVDLWATNERDCWIGYADKWSAPNVEAFTTSHKEQGYTVQRVTVSSAGFEAGIEAAAKRCEQNLITTWTELENYGEKFAEIHNNALKNAADAIRRLSPGGIEAGEAERLLREAQRDVRNLELANQEASKTIDRLGEELAKLRPAQVNGGAIDAHLSARGGK